MKQVTVRELQNALRMANYVPKRTKGSHQIWTNGEQNIVVPVARLKYVIAAKIIKKCDLSNYLKS